MTNSSQQPRFLRGLRSLIPTISMTSLILLAGSAHGIGLSLTQIGGTAVNGRGVVGDSIIVAVDLTLAEDEVLLSAFPTLAWDLEGGNVLDIVSAEEGIGAALGSVVLQPINSRYLLTNSGALGGRDDRFFDDGTAFLDAAIGTTIMAVGFELFIPLSFDAAYRAEILANGFPGPTSLRMGVATFRLSGLGTTTLGFFRDSTSTFRTIVAGAEGVVINNNDVAFTDLPVSGLGFNEFQITVIPEPSSAVLITLGLLGLSLKRSQDAQAIGSERDRRRM